MRRAAFLIDGFNLYHSLVEASRALGGASTRWLDLRALCSTFLYQLGGGARISSLHYFSALAHHVEPTKPGATTRHLTYLRALRASGVIVELGTFKEKWRHCSRCGAVSVTHEEKETDVAIAVRLLELNWSTKCDLTVLLSADSDLSPAVREVTRSFPQRPVFCCFPYGRGSEGLRALAAKCFRIRKERYAQHQFADPLPAADGSLLSKPSGW